MASCDETVISAECFSNSQADPDNDPGLEICHSVKESVPGPVPDLRVWMGFTD